MNARLGFGALRLAGLCFCLTLISNPGRTQAALPSLGVTELGYIDTSGEQRDQRGDHERRLKGFTESLRADLATSGKFRIVSLDCSPDACSASTTDPVELIAAAEKAGAAYLLLGGIHKESTLVQWAKIEILDVGAKRVVFARLLTFRGDDDSAWNRAEAFLARDILDQGAFR
jgi:Protein of unknown function (DUF2380)